MILVTGAAGFIGSNLVTELSHQGFKIRAVDCFLEDSYPESIKRSNWSKIGSLPNVERVVFDLRRQIPDDIFSGVSIIVNEAAMPGLVKSWTDFDVYSSCNISVVNNLLLGALRSDIGHFIQISTSSVYGEADSIDESSDLRPISPYGVTKLAAEDLVRMFHRTFGVQYTILRYFSVYGPAQRPDMAYAKFINKIHSGIPVEIFGDGNQVRTNTYVGDCVDATILAIKAKAQNSEFNISGGEKVSLLDAVQEIAEQLKMSPELIFLDGRNGDQKVTVGNFQKATKVFGYAPKTGFVEGISKQITWYMRGQTQS
jgi:nucleoside-diphosphate-sugar epimerase